MEPSTYNAFADMLAKFHTSPAIIQALWLVAVPATLVGVTWCLSGVLREAIRALSGRRGAALDLEALEAASVPRLGFGDGEPLRLAGPAGDAAGLSLHWPKLDADLYLPGLLEGRTGSRRWMAETLGAKGGAATSKAKGAAARRNGRLGGRPRKKAAA